jgi:hypothetical protein
MTRGTHISPEVRHYLVWGGTEQSHEFILSTYKLVTESNYTAGTILPDSSTVQPDPEKKNMHNV